MRLLIEQAALHKALTRVAAIVERKGTIPIISHVLLTADAEGLRLTGTDLDIQSVCRVPAVVERNGATTLNAVTFSDIVRNAPAGAQIEIASDSEYRLSIAFGESRFDLTALPATDFPARRDDGWPYELTIACHDLHAILSRAIFAATTDETRYFMLGVYLHMVGENGRPWLRGAGVSPTRMAYSQAPREPGSPVFPGVRLPRKAVSEFMRALDARADMATLHISTSAVRLTVGDFVLTTNLMDGDYPDYARPVADTWATTATINRQALISAVTRVAVLSGDKERGVRLALEDGRLTVTVRNPAAGMAAERVEVVQDGPDFVAGFNSRYLLDALNQSELKMLRLLANDPKSPICLRPLADDPEAASFLTMLGTMAVAA